MASQQPRPPWFRFSSIASRAPAAPPTRPPPQVPAPAPSSFSFRPPPQQRVASPPPPAPPPPPPPAAPPAPPPPAPAPAPPRSPVRAPVPQSSPPIAPAAAAPAAPPRSPVGVPAPQPSPPAPASPAATPSSPVGAPAPQPSPPRPPAAAPLRSPVAVPAPQSSPPRPPHAAPPRSPVPQPAQPFPPPAPPPATKSPLTSPVQKRTLSTSTYASPITKSQVPFPSTQTSPVQKPISTSEAVNGKTATPIPSPKIIKPSERNQSESPKDKPLSRPPSPFALPPAQIKSDGESKPMIEQKNVVVQQVLRANHNNGIASNGKREATSKDKGTSKKLSDSEEMEVRMITLAGENKGAVMELSPSRKKNGSPRKNGDRSGSESGEEGKSRNKEKANGGMTMQSPMMSYFNSNVQGLNNSIVYNTTFRHKDPGIHLSLKKANGDRSKD